MNFETKDWLEIIVMVVAATAFVVTSSVWLKSLKASLDHLAETIEKLGDRLDGHESRLTGLEWFTGMKKPKSNP